MLDPLNIDLVRQAQRGDRRAFGDLVRLRQNAVYGLAFHRIGDTTDAQDIAQEVFLKAFRCLGQLQDAGRFDPWLNAITVNECRLWGRRRRDRRQWEERALTDAVDGGAEWARRERQAAVLEAVGSLPEADRLVITLHYLTGLGCDEIAGFLGATVVAVEGRLARARRRLKKEMLEMAEEGLGHGKLGEAFTDAVLQRLTLTPGGYATVTMGSATRTMLLGPLDGNTADARVALTLSAADQGAILPSPFDAGDEAVQAKSRAFACTTEILEAFGIRMKQAVLVLDAASECRARVTFARGRTAHEVDLAPGDALALAARLGASVLADQEVIRRKKISAHGLQPGIEASVEEWAEEVAALHGASALQDMAFDAGLAPEEGRDTARYTRDESEGALRIEAVGSGRPPLTLDLSAHRAAVDRLWRGEGFSRECTRGGRFYGLEYTTQPNELQVRYIPTRTT